MTTDPERREKEEEQDVGAEEDRSSLEHKAPEPVSPEEIDQAIEEADWEDLPESARETFSRVRMEKYSYKGIVPPPHMLQQFEDVVEGSAKQIMEDAHRQLEHRHEMERKEIDSVVGIEKRGQIFAFVITMTIVLGGLGLIFTDKGVAGFALLIPGLASLAGVFIYSEWRQRQDSYVQQELTQEQEERESQNDN